MRSAKLAAVAGTACLVFGCGGQSTGANMGASGDAGVANRLEGGDASSSVSSAVDARVSGDDAKPPLELARQPTVWIGQTDKTVTYPGGFDGGSTVPYQPDPTPPEKVVLILSTDTGSVAGTITFGDVGPPAPPVDPKASYPLEPTLRQDPDGKTFALLPSNWTLFPYSGFSYSLVSSGLSGNVLNLAFVPSDLWRGWCAMQDPTVGAPRLSDNTSACVCSAGACRAPSSPIRRFVLTVSGDTMQGELPGESAEVAVPVMRLQRVK